MKILNRISQISQMWALPSNDSRSEDGPPPKIESSLDSHRLRPLADVDSSENYYFVRMDIPGMSADDLDIDVNTTRVKVSGRRFRSTDQLYENPVHRERPYGKFTRIINLPSPVHAGKFSVEHRNGVLMIKLPKLLMQATPEISENEYAPGMAQMELEHPTAFKKTGSDDESHYKFLEA